MRHCQTLALVLSLTACEKASELTSQPSPQPHQASPQPEPADPSVGITQQEPAPPTPPRAIETRRAPTRAVIRAQPPSDLPKQPAPILAPQPVPAPLPALPPSPAVAVQPRPDVAPPPNP